MARRRSRHRTAAGLVAGVLLGLASPASVQAQPLRDSALFVFGVSAHAEWEVYEGRFVTRYAAHAVQFVSDMYPGQVHTDVGVMRRRCLVTALERARCQFRPKDGVDENVEVVWDPLMSEVSLTFRYRNHDHEVEWRGEGDHAVRPRVHTPPGLVGASAHVIRRATAQGSIYGDRVRTQSVLEDETYMWEGGFVWEWIGPMEWEQALDE
jgi:hypothetical protein